MAYHPQLDGQTEQLNQVLEQWLRCFILTRQDDWCDLLPLAMMAYNNWENSSSKVSPYYANKGFHPMIHFQRPTSLTMVPKASEFVTHIQDIHN